MSEDDVTPEDIGISPGSVTGSTVGFQPSSESSKLSPGAIQPIEEVTKPVLRQRRAIKRHSGKRKKPKKRTGRSKADRHPVEVKDEGSNPSPSANDLVELLESAGPSKDIVQPVVEALPPNWRLVWCQVGPHHRVRVMVRPDNKNYIPRMVIPLDVDLRYFDPNELLIFNGDPPRRKGQW